ncbi:MAG: hypothetical protein RLZZ528_1813 [Pseudomonadota bacterium]
MSNAEIEDVLSSIRRLVTEDLRHQRPSRLTLGPSGFRETGDALVLTPAQRVAESFAATPAQRPWSAGPDVMNIPVMPIPVRPAQQQRGPDASAAGLEGETEALASLERTISELEAAVAGIDGEFESDTGEPLATGESGDDLHRMFDGEDTGDQPEEAAAPEADFEPVADMASAEAGDDAGTGDVVEPEPVAAEAFADDAPDLVGEVVVADPAGQDASPWEDYLDTALTEGVIAGEAEVQAAVDVLSLPEPTDPEDLWLADIDGHEEDAPAASLPDDGVAVIDEASADGEVVEPDLGAESPAGAASLLAGTVTPRIHLTAARDIDRKATEESEEAAELPVAQEDHAARAPRILRAALPEAAPGPDASADDSLFDDGEEALVDADALRDLVSEIIRQELQGALGERITRNVRKLVRREINRVLESRSFE